MSPRITRSRSRHLEDPAQTLSPEPTPASLLPLTFPHLKSDHVALRLLNLIQLDTQLSRLPKRDLALLRMKQRKLQDGDAQVPAFVRERLESSSEVDTLLAQAAAATLVFAWEAAGTAVCVSPEGLLLTCSHCIAESEDDYEPAKERWLLFASGDAVKAKCVAWDRIRDLALLQITSTAKSSFPYIQVAAIPPSARAAMICIGHPGSEDFEADEPGVATGYDVLHISEGRFRGLDKDQDPQDNSEIGALKHDCWTYWGHSGAPLVSKKSGELVGLHSSWDDKTAMRRGVAWQALIAFLEEHTVPSPVS